MNPIAELLSPDGAVLTEPGQVERALAAMWKQSAEAAVKGDGRQAATRVCMANLIVVGESREWDRLLEVLGELSPIYPTRTIVLLLEHKADQSTKPAVRAAVTAICHVPQPGRPQVCCDQIVLRSGVAAADDLDRTLLPLLESDVPVMVWWTLEPSRCAGLIRALRSLARRIILDCGLSGLELLGIGRDESVTARHDAAVSRCAVRELGWYRVRRWRELLAGMFDGCGPEVLREVEHLSIEIGDASPELSLNAIWLTAFIGGQLGWTVDDKAVAKPANLKSQISNLKSEFVLRSNDRSVPVVVSQKSGEGIVAVTLKSGGDQFEARRCREELRIFVHNANVCGVPRCVQLPRQRRSEALAAALTGRQVDAAFDRAAPIAVRLAAQLEKSG